MKISTVREFRDRATVLMRTAEPLLVTRRGRLAGIYLPWTGDTLPEDMKKELFLALSADIGQRLSQSGATEDDVLADFQDWKEKRRASRRGR